MMRRERFPVITTNAAGGGTVLSSSPIMGEVLEIACESTALTTGGSADITVTRVDDGGTVLAITNQAAGTWRYQPRVAQHSLTGGTTAYGLGQGPVLAGGVPVAGHLRLVVLQGALSASGTVDVYYRE